MNNTTTTSPSARPLTRKELAWSLYQESGDSTLVASKMNTRRDNVRRMIREHVMACPSFTPLAGTVVSVETFNESTSGLAFPMTPEFPGTGVILTMDDNTVIVAADVTTKSATWHVATLNGKVVRGAALSEKAILLGASAETSTPLSLMRCVEGGLGVDEGWLSLDMYIGDREECKKRAWADRERYGEAMDD